MDNRRRCGWVNQDELYLRYHDEEWGVPVYDDTKLFEFLILEGAQAGLSWYTVLKKRENYRKAFHDFNIDTVSRYGEDDVARLQNDPGIIRNRLKIESAISNARCVLSVQQEFGSFAKFAWSYVDGKPIINHWPSLSDVPATSLISDKMSKDMKKRGFRFVGSTILYSFLQATGMIMDHIQPCFRYEQLLNSPQTYGSIQKDIDSLNLLNSSQDY